MLHISIRPGGAGGSANNSAHRNGVLRPENLAKTGQGTEPLRQAETSGARLRKIYYHIMKDSKIEWTHHTFNPWWGCAKVSPGCSNCYAEPFAKRTGHAVWGTQSPRRFFGDKHWGEPLKWNAAAKAEGMRKRVFCASMADVFENRPDLLDARQRLFQLIDDTPWLDWLLLTKRPENIVPMMMLSSNGTFGAHWNFRDHMPNVWLGTTAEDQQRWDERLPHLMKIQASVHFVSCEPLLGGIEMGIWLPEWLIAGGESGARSRPMHPAWARGLRDQCTGYGIPFLFKQWGEWHPAINDDAPMWTGVDGEFADAPLQRIGKKAAGRALDGRTWDEYPCIANKSAGVMDRGRE